MASGKTRRTEILIETYEVSRIRHVNRPSGPVPLTEPKPVKTRMTLKQKRVLVIAVLIAALSLVAAYGLFRSAEGVHAQDQIPLPTQVRVSFGSVGITSGQSVRVSVTKAIMPSEP